MRVIAYIASIAIGLFIVMLIIGASMSPEERQRQSQRKAIDDFCDNAMADSALGRERRMTREMCDKLKESAKAGK